MLKQDSLFPYGTEDPASLMELFHKSGNDIILKLRNYVTNPDNIKKPRIWGAIEAAKMANISAPTFRKIIENHENIPGIIDNSSEKGRNNKGYTLEAINHIRDLVGTRYVRPEGSTPLIIAISNLKGGVGKTQTAVDLGKKIAIEGLKVLLLDFDAQATATLISSGLIPDLELKYEDTITDALIAKPEIMETLIKKTHFHGFDIIPANLAIQDCDLILPNIQVNNSARLGSPFSRLSRGLDSFKNKYDVVLIDCGPNIGALTLNAVTACDGMIIPIPPNMNDYSSFNMYASTLNSLFEQFDGKQLQYFRILFSKHPGNNESLQMANMMRTIFGHYSLSNHMCETVEVAKAASEIGTIYDISKPRGSRDAYRRALQHLDDVTMEIINNFKDIWAKQAQFSKKQGAMNESRTEKCT